MLFELDDDDGGDEEEEQVGTDDWPHVDGDAGALDDVDDVDARLLVAVVDQRPLWLLQADT